MVRVDARPDLLGLSRWHFEDDALGCLPGFSNVITSPFSLFSLSVDAFPSYFQRSDLFGLTNERTRVQWAVVQHGSGCLALERAGFDACAPPYHSNFCVYACADKVGPVLQDIFC